MMCKVPVRERMRVKIHQHQALQDLGAPTRLPRHLIDNYNLNNEYAEIALTPAEEKFHQHMHELNEINCVSIDHLKEELIESDFVGAMGTSFQHTSQPQVISYDKDMKTEDKSGWIEAVTKEHNSFKKYKVWKAMKKTKAPKDAKVLISTWAMKPKSNGTKQARLTACEFE
eukprot:13250051-Ditylum_brightwellii.AAC.2